MLRHRLPRPACVLAVLFAWLGISTAPPALAIDSTWNADASSNWSSATNWTSGVPDAIGDIARLTYNITAARAVIIDTSSRTVGFLYLSDDNFGYTLVGGGLNLDVSSGSALIQSDGGTGVTHSISVPVALYDSTTVAVNSATLQVVGISSSVAGTGITKTGAGTLVFRGLNTYTGATTISAGTLLLGANNAIPGGSSVTVQGGSTLDIGAYSTSAGTVTLVDGTITGTTGVLAGSSYDVRKGTISAHLVGTGGLSKTTADTVTLAAQNSYTGATTVSGGTLTLGGSLGAIVSTSGVTITGGTLLLNNTSSGSNFNRLPDSLALTMNGGTLNFSNDASAANFSEVVGRLNLSSGASTVATSQAASGQTSTLVFITNPGMTRSAGATVNFTGTGLGTDARNRIVFTTAPTLDDGIIGGWAISNNDFAKYITSPVTSVAPLASGDYYTGASSTWASKHNVKLTSTTGISGDTVINSLDFAQTAATSLFLNSNLLRVESGGILISGSFGAAIVGAGTLSAGTGADTAGELIIHQNSSSDANISGEIADNGSGTVSLTKAGTGAGSIILYGYNTYTGPTVIASGRMKVNTYGALGSPAAGTTVMNGATLELGPIGANMFEPVTLSGTGVSNSGALRGTATCVFNGPITLAGDTRINADSGTTLTLTLNNEPISGNYNLTFGGAGNVVVYTISIGTGTLTKDGTGILTLTGKNPSWGATTISAGTIRLGALNTIPTGSSVTVQGGGTLDIGAYSTSAGTVTLVDGTITGTTSGLTGSAYEVRKGTISAHLVGSGGITKTTADTVTLAAPNNYTGATTISAGTLRLGAASAIPSGSSVTVQGGSTLDIGAYGTGAGTVQLIDGTITGTTGVLAGSAYDVRKGAIGAHLVGTGELTKTTADTVTLAAANSYTGKTTISAGTLRLGANNAITVESEVVVLGGSTLDIGAYTSFPGAVTLIDGTITGTTGSLYSGFDVRKGTISAKLDGWGLKKTTAGTVTLAAANIYFGDTTISAGTLRLGIPNAIPSVSSVTVEGGSTLDIGAYFTSAGIVTLIDGTITGGWLGGTDYQVCKGTISAELAGTGGLTKTTADTVTLAAANNYMGSTYINGGVIRITNSRTLGNSDVGTQVTAGAALEIATGADTVKEPLIIYGTGISNGGALRCITNSSCGNVEVTSASRINADSGATLTLDEIWLSSGDASVTLGGAGNIVVSTVISIGAGTLTKDGTGILTVSGPNSCTGAMTIAAGTLKLAAEATMASSLFDIAAGATLDVRDFLGGYTLPPGAGLKGGGTVLGDLVVTGAVAPGSSPGILSVEDIIFAAGGTMEVELGDTVRGSGYDVLASSGSVTLQDGSSLAVTLINAFVPEKGDAFDILDFAALSGQFGTVTLPALGENLAWNTDGLYTSGVIKVVPEPGCAALLMAGLAWAMLRRCAGAAAKAAV